MVSLSVYGMSDMLTTTVSPPVETFRQLPALSFRVAKREDLSRIVDLGARFFQESEFPAFTSYDPARFLRVLEMAHRNDAMIHILAELDTTEMLAYPETPSSSELVGFVSFDVNSYYTRHKIAHLFLLYAVPEHRASPIGRLLMTAAVEVARNEGAVAFYAGAMAGINQRQEKQLMNMLYKIGFEPLGGFARKIL